MWLAGSADSRHSGYACIFRWNSRRLFQLQCQLEVGESEPQLLDGSIPCLTEALVWCSVANRFHEYDPLFGADDLGVDSVVHTRLPSKRRRRIGGRAEDTRVCNQWVGMKGDRRKLTLDPKKE